jgi:transcriptional regulator with XRE-family HTH domain
VTHIRANGAAIRALRAAYGWKPSKFATAVQVSHGYLTNIEAGRKQPSPEVLRRIADALNVPLAAITSEYSAGEVA